VIAMPAILPFETLRFRAFATLAALLCATTAQAQAELLVSGTGSGTGGMQLVAQAFMQAHPEVRVVVQPAIGSAGGIRAVVAGKLSIALSNREPNQAERADAELVAVEYARTPFVVAVHNNQGLAALSGDQLAALFAPGATYPNGQRARPVLRRADAGDTQLLKSMAPALAAAVDAASERRGMLDAATDSEAADMVAHTPGAFAASTLALIAAEKRPFTALAIDGREPTVDNLAKGRYPFHKRLFAITAKAPSPEVGRFLAFLRSPATQALLRANGHLPL
jgi:phosphate transport system substrate-binding protein